MLFASYLPMYFNYPNIAGIGIEQFWSISRPLPVLAQNINSYPSLEMQRFLIALSVCKKNAFL